MKNCLALILSVIFALTSQINAMSSPDDFFTRDPEATYDERFTDIEVVIEIPGYKLDPQNALAIPIGKEEYEYAQRINSEILEKAKKYTKYNSINITKDYHIYAAKDLGNYILLYFDEPEVMDGGFELIYSKKLNKIIGTFSAGHKG